MIEVKDNFLNTDDFCALRDEIMSPRFPWYFSSYTVKDGETLSQPFYSHMFYIDYAPNSDHMSVPAYLINEINPAGILRIKANSYLKSDIISEADMHQDYSFEQTTSIFYVNTNDGYTKFDDGTIVESVANRLVTFDGRQYHCSTNCTDQERRVNISLSYIKG